MRSLLLLVSLVVVAVFTQASALAVSPRIVVRPAVVKLHDRSTITVSGLSCPSLEVRLVGATSADGALLPWRSLRLVRGVWRGSLPTPALHGLYPIELRTATGSAPIRPQLYMRIFEAGTGARPSFADPADAVRWWVRTVPRATLVALRAWPRPGFDRRDLRLHRLFVVAYSRPGHRRVGDRLGMFVTAVRDGYRGGWRILEATVEP